MHVIALADAGAGLRAHPCRQFGMIEETAHCRSERPHIAHGHHQPAFAVAHGFAASRRVGGDDGATAGHGFEDGARHPFAQARRQDQHMCRRQIGPDVAGGPAPDRVAGIVPGPQSFGVDGIGIAVGRSQQVQPELATLAAQGTGGLDQVFEPLASQHPGDEQKDRHTVGQGGGREALGIGARAGHRHHARAVGDHAEAAQVSQIGIVIVEAQPDHAESMAMQPDGDAADQAALAGRMGLGKGIAETGEQWMAADIALQPGGQAAPDDGLHRIGQDQVGAAVADQLAQRPKGLQIADRIQPGALHRHGQRLDPDGAQGGFGLGVEIRGSGQNAMAVGDHAAHQVQPEVHQRPCQTGNDENRQPLLRRCLAVGTERDLVAWHHARAFPFRPAVGCRTCG